METPLCIGVDVGGTNTDAVVLQGKNVLSSCKVATTQDVTSGVQDAIRRALDGLSQAHSSSAIRRVNIGTTHFVNAIIERSCKLAPVTVLRLCGPASVALPPFCDFPEDLLRCIGGVYFFCQGGLEYDGQEITKVDPQQIKQCVENSKEKGIKNFVIAGIFSTFCNAQEVQVAEIIREVFPEASVTLSHTIGHDGLLERENASILNECLKPLCSATVAAFQQSLLELNLGCPFFLTQNDGTILQASQVIEFPVLTISSGPTNSMRGAMFLSGQADSIVIDIGGTTTDAGVLCKGFPREAAIKKEVGGVNTNFQIPDVLSVGLGGGSIVRSSGDKVVVGPESVGFRLTSDSLAFGGETVTATDVALAKKLCHIPGADVSRLSNLDEGLLQKASELIKERIECLIDRMKTSEEDQPVILVGGGSVLVDHSVKLRGASVVIKPDHYEVANAVGAALNQVSGSADGCFLLDQEGSREKVVQEMKDKAIEAAIKHGAVPESVKIARIDAVPVSYLPGNLTRFHCIAIGDMCMDKEPCKSSESTETKELKNFSTDSCQREQSPSSPVDTKPDNTEEKPMISVCKEEESPQSREDQEVQVDAVTGEWILRESDVDCIAIGAGILGCGGGGSPYTGSIKAKLAIRKGKRIGIIHPNKVFSDEKYQSGWIPLVFFMGAPTILIEKLTNGEEIITSLKIVEAMLNSCGRTQQEQNGGMSKIPDVDAFLSTKQLETGREKFVALVSGEIGGLNALEPLIVGAELGLPVLDADTMGRAFPELQMVVPSFNDIASCPAAIVADNGKKAATFHAGNFKELELFFRDRVVWMGCSGGVCMCPMRAEQVSRNTVHYSQSRAWKLGKAVLTARATNTSPVEAILEHENGKLLMVGKIVDVQRYTKGGFNLADIKVEGLEDFLNRTLLVIVQNENLLAYEQSDDGTKTVLASTPDLISIVVTESGEPVPTEEVKYGLRVSVIGMPCDPIMRTPAALKYVGPEAFHLEGVNYSPIGDYKYVTSLCPE